MDIPEVGSSKSKLKALIGKFSGIFDKSKRPDFIDRQPEEEQSLKQPDLLETKEPQTNTQEFIGLERLDEILSEERFLESFRERVPESAKSKIAEKLEALRSERQQILDRYSLQPLIDEYKKERARIYGEVPDIKDALSLARIIQNNLAQNLPPVKDGYIRMYRGEGGHPGVTDDWTVGRWFAHDLDIVSGYPIGSLGDNDRRMVYVDIPRKDLRKYHVQELPEFKGASKGGEYLLPSELIQKTKEFVRFIRSGTQEDPWPTNKK